MNRNSTQYLIHRQCIRGKHQYHSMMNLHSMQRIAQDFLLIWINSSSNPLNENDQNSLTQLRNIVSDVRIFYQQDQAVDFLTGINVMKTFLIVNSNIGELIVPHIHDILQLDVIFIYCQNQPIHEQWTKKWVKIKGIFTEIKPICEELQFAVKQYNQDVISVSFLSMNEIDSTQKLNQLEASFVYTQIFKDILLEIEHEDNSIEYFTNYCRTIYKDNARALSIIQDFEDNYRNKSPIWWYTRECFTYQMLNRALRLLQGDIIINMGFFICDIHRQIQQLHQQQVTCMMESPS